MEEQSSQDGGKIEPCLWVERHGDCLFRYALSRLGETQAAEDLVQETFLAALASRGTFAGRASERAWLLGILRHKLADYCRRSKHLSSLGDLSPTANSLEDLFDDRGRWRIKPLPDRTDPGAALERQEFWETFRRCLTQLPARLAAAFTLREVDGLSSEEVRALLEVSANNLWVLLHRARLGLGRCLDLHWFHDNEARE